MPPQDTRLQRFGMPRMCPFPHFATALLELARPAPVFPDHRLDTAEVSWSTVAPLAPAIPITAPGAHIFEPAPAGAAPATNLPRQTRLNQPITRVCILPRHHPPGVSLHAPAPSAAQTHPTALLHIRQILHWTGRPGPKSGTDLSDITQSEPQLTQVRGVRVASTSTRRRSPTDFFICSSPNYGRRPGTGLDERHGAVTHVHTVVRLEGIHHLLYASTAKADFISCSYVYLSSVSSLGCREPLPLLDKPTLGSISVHTDVHVTAHPRMASLFTGAGGTPVPLSEPRPPHDGKAPPQHQHSAALPETPQTLSTA